MKILQKDGTTADWPAGKPLPDGARVSWDLSMRDAALVEEIANNTVLTDADRSYAKGVAISLKATGQNWHMTDSQAAYEKRISEGWKA